MKMLNTLVKFILIAAATCAAGYLVTFYIEPGGILDSFLLRIVQLFAMGFICGLTSRIFFNRRKLFLRFLAVLIFGVLALLILDYFFDNRFGIILLQDGIRPPEIDEASQMGLLFVASIFTAFIGVRKKAKSQPIQKRKTQKPSSLLQRTQKKIKKQTKKIGKSLSSARPKVQKKAAPKSTSSGRKTKIALQANKPVRVKSSASSKKKTTTRKRISKSTEENGVKLVGSEEHRCPYCLEIVKKGDPRGVRICPDCGTWHHKDCWDITGACQVAHRNEL